MDCYQFTAGQYKRTVDMLTQPTDEDKQHMQKQVDDIHQHFKAHIASHRPQVDLAEVANGDFWLARQAMNYQLVDELQTSDEVIENYIAKGAIVMAIQVNPKSVLHICLN